MVNRTMTPLRKEKIAKKYVENNRETKQINTSVGNTPYVKNVIAAFVKGDENAFKQLYKEPVKLAIGMKAPTKEEMQQIVNRKKEEVLKQREIKQDNTIVKRPKGF